MSPKKKDYLKTERHSSSNDLIKKPQFISEEEWNLPAGFRADGSIATLAEVITPQVSTMNLVNLNSVSKKQLVIERIKKQKSYPILSFLGMNDINQKGAIYEVEKQTNIGKIIERAEQNAIQIMIERATKELKNE
jgi:hypothetical protein